MLIISLEAMSGGSALVRLLEHDIDRRWIGHEFDVTRRARVNAKVIYLIAGYSRLNGRGK